MLLIRNSWWCWWWCTNRQCERRHKQSTGRAFPWCRSYGFISKEHSQTCSPESGLEVGRGNVSTIEASVKRSDERNGWLGGVTSEASGDDNSSITTTLVWDRDNKTNNNLLIFNIRWNQTHLITTTTAWAPIKIQTSRQQQHGILLLRRWVYQLTPYLIATRAFYLY